MALLSGETLAKSAGDLFLAPYPEAAPVVADIATTATLEAAGWVHVGWLHEDGPSVEGFEGDTTRHYGWNAVAPILTITRVTEPQVPVSLLQWNVENLQLYFPGTTYDAGTQVLTIPETGNPVEQALLLRIADGADWIAIWVAKVTARGGASFEFPGDGLAPIPVVFDVLSTGDDASYVKVIGLEMAGTGESS
jgi:hypothetical protein